MPSPIRLSLATGDPLSPVTSGTITVYETGTTNTVSLYEENNTPLANPYSFTSSSITLYADQQIVDIEITSSSLNKTITGYRVGEYTSDEIKALYESETDTNVYTDAERDKLAQIEAQADVSPVSSVSEKVGFVVLDKSDVGLANVDNTSDLNKPISNATQAELNNKATLAQGALADTALQPLDNITSLNNNAGYISNITGESIDDLSNVDLTGITSGDVLEWNGSGFIVSNKLTGIETGAQVNTVLSVNSQTGNIVLSADDIDDSASSHKFATQAQLDNADSALQTGDNISELINDSGYLTSTPNTTYVQVNQSTHGLNTGDAIYYDGSVWQKAQANDAATLATNIAEVDDVDNFKAVIQGPITLIGLTPGDYYFTSGSTAGTLTNVEPTTGFSNPVGQALSSTIFMVLPWRAQEI